MSSSTLTTVQNQLNRYGYPTFMVLGVIGNTLVVILLNRHRQNACSIYLISSAVFNTIYLIFSTLTKFISIDYSTKTNNVFAFCKINIYLINVLGQIGKTMVVLACFDRFMMTSERVTFRAFSTPKRATWLVFWSVIFWPLFTVHIPIMTTIINGQCTSRVGVYGIIYSIYTIVFVGVLPVVILILFGYLAYRNMRQIQLRVQPIGQNVAGGNVGIRRRDRDLLVMVIAEVIVYVITTILFPFILLEMLISSYVISNKSVQYLITELFINNISVLLLFVGFALPFYIYLISSKPFYRDFRQLMISCYRRLGRQPPIQPAPRTHHPLTQNDFRI